MSNLLKGRLLHRFYRSLPLLLNLYSRTFFPGVQCQLHSERTQGTWKWKHDWYKYVLVIVKEFPRSLSSIAVLLWSDCVCGLFMWSSSQKVESSWISWWGGKRENVKNNANACPCDCSCMHDPMQEKLASSYISTNFSFVISVDICSSSPCLNNGSCVINGPTGYLCTCRPGYSGTHCESKKYISFKSLKMSKFLLLLLSMWKWGIMWCWCIYRISLYLPIWIFWHSLWN